jgi:CheY-like chemotaxis protein
VKRFLVIDDEDNIRQALTGSLQTRFDAVVTQATSGNEAIALLKDNSFDLVISDVSMPDGTGLDVLKFLMEINSKTPLIFFTGNNIADFPYGSSLPLIAVINKSAPKELYNFIQDQKRWASKQFKT